MSTDCENLLKRFLVLNPAKRGTFEVRDDSENVNILRFFIHSAMALQSISFHPPSLHPSTTPSIHHSSAWHLLDTPPTTLFLC